MTLSLLTKIQRRIWRIALKIPLAKSFLLIINSYVWMGDPRALLQAAPIWLYIRRFWLKIISIFIFSLCFIVLGRAYGYVKCEPLNTLDSALQIFPNVLGFGIGAYALLFTFPERFFNNLEDGRRSRQLRIGAQGLNAIMAFPLLAIATIILVATILKLLILEDWIADVLGFFFLLYGIILTIELIAALFVSARKVIRNVVKIVPENENTDDSTAPQESSTTEKQS